MVHHSATVVALHYKASWMRADVQVLVAKATNVSDQSRKGTLRLPWSLTRKAVRLALLSPFLAEKTGWPKTQGPRDQSQTAKPGPGSETGQKPPFLPCFTGFPGRWVASSLRLILAKFDSKGGFGLKCPFLGSRCLPAGDEHVQKAHFDGLRTIPCKSA